MSSALFFQIQSFVVVCLLTFGLIKKKSKEVHMKTMFVAIVWDILLVLQIELNRGAILKASKALTNPMQLNVHVALAVTCVLCYFVMLYSGSLLKKNEFKLKKLHKNLGIATYLLRWATFITSFFAVIPKN